MRINVESYWSLSKILLHIFYVALQGIVFNSVASIFGKIVRHRFFSVSVNDYVSYK
jgi:hypothetical protein